MLIYCFHVIGKGVYIWKTRHVRRPLGLFGIGGGDLTVKEAQVRRLRKESKEFPAKKAKAAADREKKKAEAEAQRAQVAQRGAESGQQQITAGEGAEAKRGGRFGFAQAFNNLRGFGKKTEPAEEEGHKEIDVDTKVDEEDSAGIILQNYLIARRQFKRFTDRNGASQLMS